MTLRPEDPHPTAQEAGAADGESASPRCDSFRTPRDARFLRRFNVWMVAAALAYLGATAALRWRASIPAVLPAALVALAALLSIQAVRAYLTFLRGADELLRRIQTEALALGFASGAVTSLLYPLLEGFGAPRLGAQATTVVMMLAWSLGSWLGTRRYSGSDGA